MRANEKQSYTLYIIYARLSSVSLLDDSFKKSNFCHVNGAVRTIYVNYT